MSHKKNVETALARYLIKAERKRQGPQRKNQKPEKLVQDACLLWMREMKWDVQIYEAKATYDPGRNVWHNQAMRAGNCDCQGVSDRGEAIYVEFKALGKRSTFNRNKNLRQKEFLIAKINSFAFGCVVDSREILQEIYAKWRTEKSCNGEIAARNYLLEALP